jgi:hypothetical protein
VSTCELIELPLAVVKATRIDWGVPIDAYLMDAARVGDRLTGLVYCDLSRVSSDGMTVVTPEIRDVRKVNGFTLVRSLTLRDHYVIVSELSTGDLGDA